MNKPTRLFLAAVSLIMFLAACDGPEEVAREPRYRASKIEEIGYKRELTYNESGQVVKITSTSEMVDKEVISSIQEIEYDLQGNISKLVVDDHVEFFYTWENEKIVVTEEKYDGDSFQRYSFSYHADGQVKEMLIHKYLPEGLKLAGKVSYAFYADGNLSTTKNFTFKEDVAYELETIYELDRYDDRESVDSEFDLHTLNPKMRMHRNNPGRMVMKNKNGVAVSIEDYVFEYNLQGLPLKRESTITFLHMGSTGSFITNYFFEEY
jgi:hypothetical protein